MIILAGAGDVEEIAQYNSFWSELGHRALHPVLIRMDILLLGPNGQVGHELRRLAQPLGEVTKMGRSEVDLMQPEQIWTAVEETQPDVVLNAAAYTAVDRAEEEPDRAKKVNAEAPRILAKATREVGAWLVHYSTDYVFDGEKRKPYTEDDQPNPVNEYGKTKYEGEEAIRAVSGKHLILRTSWVYSDRRSNFFRTMLRLGEEYRQGEHDRLTVVDDQIGNPTWSGWIAEATVEIVRTLRKKGLSGDFVGTYHLASAGQTSWYGFAQRIFSQFGYDEVEVEPVPTTEYPTPATRPKYAVLDTTRLQETFGLTPPSWAEQLDVLWNCMNE